MAIETTPAFLRGLEQLEDHRERRPVGYARPREAYSRDEIWPFDPSKFEDHYESALQDLLEKKKNGMPIAKRAAPSSGNVINLMEALKASLKEGGKSAPAPVKATKKATKATPASKKRKAG